MFWHRAGAMEELLEALDRQPPMLILHSPERYRMPGEIAARVQKAYEARDPQPFAWYGYTFYWRKE
jgi:hypothetical protein